MKLFSIINRKIIYFFLHFNMEIVLITMTLFDNTKNKKITKGNIKMEKISAEALLRAFFLLKILNWNNLLIWQSRE